MLIHVFFLFLQRKTLIKRKIFTMSTSTIINICGWVATFGLIFGYLPQAIQTIRTRFTDGISLPGFISMAIGCAAFVVQGFLLENFYLVTTNLITCTCSVIIFAIKMHNDYGKKKKED